MTFQDTLFETDYTVWANIAIVLGCSAAFAFFPLIACFTTLDGFGEKIPRLKFLIIGISFIALLITSIFAGVNSQQDKNEADNQLRQDALIGNVMQKYNVDEVTLKGEDYRLEVDEPGEQNIIVKVDGQKYSFLLTQDETTFEPTLENPPVPGGTVPEGISADDLLKDKTDQG